MVVLKFADQHNEVAYLVKTEEKDGPKFWEIIDYLNHSYIHYALTFWLTAKALTIKDYDEDTPIPAISATVDDGTIDMAGKDILSAILKLGYDVSNGKLTFDKGSFSPNWRFLIHTLLHCLGPKRSSWEQFSSSIAVALVYFSKHEKYNFSKMIFESMVKNADSEHKFLMYPKFVQLFLKAKQSLLLPHKRILPTPCLQQKVFQNMSMKTKGWTGEEKPLTEPMLAFLSQVQSAGSASPTDPQITPIVVPTTTHIPTVTQTYRKRHRNVSSSMATFIVPQPHGLGTSGGVLSSPAREDTEPMLHDAPLTTGETVGSAEGSVNLKELMKKCTTLSKQVAKLEKDLAKTQRQHAMDNKTLRAHIEQLQEEVQQLKNKRRVNIVKSSSSSGDDDTDNDDDGDSPKQGRKTNAETEGRRLNFKEEGDGTDVDFSEDADQPQPTEELQQQQDTEEVLQEDTEIFDLDAHKEGTDTATSQAQQDTAATTLPVQTQEGTDSVIHEETEEAEYGKKRKEKGKAPMTAEEASLQQNKVKPRVVAQLDYDAEVAKKFREEELANKAAQDELEVASFMEAKRLENEELASTNIFGQLSEYQIELMIATDPVVKQKEIELLADRSLTEEQRSAQLADFILMKNDQAFDDMVSSIQKSQKKKRKPSKAQVIAGMKKFLCNQANFKMSQFRGMTYEEIESHYYIWFRRTRHDFIPMDSQKETEFLKRHGIHMESKKEKKQKTEEPQSEILTEEQLDAMVMIKEEDFYPKPLQTRHPIVDWEIYTDDFVSTWKITRLGGETSSFMQFEDLIRACDRDDLDTLWKTVNDKHKAGKLQDIKEKELWFHFQRLYEPDKDVRYWKFKAHTMNTLWKFYDNYSVHHLSTQDGVDAFMLAEREYPLRAGILLVMLPVKLRCEERTEEINDLLQRISEQCSRETQSLKKRWCLEESPHHQR
ncbi:hypothetical protein CTI12_AA109180 [Artemisia annua]|uniref:Synaptobrevin, longin-like domain protein n=1 Tax=Artemisia annua TaxID=35608 RepID=A0A2U1PUJ4_ARTAN|nr:hypothetical protein CTI12_AA109180 [Artemisia annua]